MPEKIDFQFESPNQSPGYLLGQLTMLWQRKHKRMLDPLGLTHTQFVLLAALGWLSRENENITQTDIAHQANADRMMVSKVLRKLEEKKLITRKGHSVDTRAKVIKLTNKGAELLQKALVLVENTDIDFFSALGAELPTFNARMLKLIEANKEE